MKAAAPVAAPVAAPSAKAIGRQIISWPSLVCQDNKSGLETFLKTRYNYFLNRECI